ncbi:MAG: hypothetical protein IKX93_01310 [Bacteroidaceae bacterium]|nr:hypothetical protein [Bacteroidaceae bacterium]
MKKSILTLIAFALTLSTAFADNTHKQQHGNIKIVAEIRPEINYVTHLYTLAGLGFSDEEYSAKYIGSVAKADLDTLRKYKDLLSFGRGEGGMFARMFFFAVGGETFSDSNALKAMIDRYRKMAEEQVPGQDMTIPNAITKVYVDNYDRYLKEVYPQAKKDMEERQKLLNKNLRKASFVNDWEAATGYRWNHGDYHWLLFRAGKQGPSYNDLNKNTNSVYYNQSFDYQMAMFSHEFGIFLMQDSIAPIFEEMKTYTRKLGTTKDLTFVPWGAFESLSCWFNNKIAGKETADFKSFNNADVQTFCKIYDGLSAEGIKSPAELYRKGIMKYLTLKGLDK